MLRRLQGRTMKPAKRIRDSFNRHVRFELAAFSLSVVVALTHSKLEHIQALRFGSHVDAVTICVTIAIVTGLVGLVIPKKAGESKRLAFVIFVFMLLVFQLPALLPPK